jgi:hypothetical protein
VLVVSERICTSKLGIKEWKTVQQPKKTYKENDAVKRIYIAVKHGFIVEIWELVWEQSLWCNEHRCSTTNEVSPKVSQVILPAQSLGETKVSDAQSMIAVNHNIGL